MRWNCPHCSTPLAYSDDRLGTNWSFSRCFRCGGFALVRPANVNLIKVDQAPPGERVIIPQAPQPLLAAPTLREESDQYTTQTFETSAIEADPDTKPKIRMGKRKKVVTLFTPKLEVRGTSLHAPPPTASGIRPLSLAIGAMSMAAITSGIYLFIEGQNLWDRARTNLTPVAQISYKDQVVQSSMAPERAPEPRITPVVEQTPAPVSVAPAVAEIPPEVSPKPVRAKPSEPAAPVIAHKPMTVEVIKAFANMRSGPGMEFPVIEVGKPKIAYTVSDWQDRWFKVIVLPQKKTAWIRNDLVKINSQ